MENGQNFNNAGTENAAPAAQNNNSRVHELIMELGGSDNVTSPGLLSSSDPMMSDTRLMNSQVPSPDIHWDSATFSPDANEHMDFVATWASD